MATICTANLTFNNSTFCPHSVFMCFVWISEQTAIISLYNINWLIFITEKECVYCAVRDWFSSDLWQVLSCYQTVTCTTFFPNRQRKIVFKFVRQNATKISLLCCTPNIHTEPSASHSNIQLFFTLPTSPPALSFSSGYLSQKDERALGYFKAMNVIVSSIIIMNIEPHTVHSPVRCRTARRSNLRLAVAQTWRR